MEQHELEQFLHTIPLFSFVEPHEMADLAGLVRAETLQEGQTLFREKEPGDALWVLAGDAEVSVAVRPADAEAPVVVARVKGGETLGEMALVDEGARSGTATVTRGGPAHRIDAADFTRLREGFRASAYKVLKKICVDLCAKLRATDRRIAPEGRMEVPKTPGEGGVSVAPERMDDFAPFRRLPQVVKLALAGQLRLIETNDIQPLFGEGEEADAAYFVLEGEVTVGRGGKTFANMGPGSMLGIVALLDKGHRSASAVTTGPAKLLRLSRRDFELLFNAGNRFAFLMLDLVARQLVAHLRNANELLAQQLPASAPGAPGAPAPATAGADEADFSDVVVTEEADDGEGEELNVDVLPLDLEIEVDTSFDEPVV